MIFKPRNTAPSARGIAAVLFATCLVQTPFPITAAPLRHPTHYAYCPQSFDDCRFHRLIEALNIALAELIQSAGDQGADIKHITKESYAMADLIADFKTERFTAETNYSQGSRWDPPQLQASSHALNAKVQSRYVPSARMLSDLNLTGGVHQTRARAAFAFAKHEVTALQLSGYRAFHQYLSLEGEAAWPNDMKKAADALNETNDNPITLRMRRPFRAEHQPKRCHLAYPRILRGRCVVNRRFVPTSIRTCAKFGSHCPGWLTEKRLSGIQVRVRSKEPNQA